METNKRDVLVGTDFSKGSYVALEIAVDIANKLNTGIHLIWVKKEKLLTSNEQIAQTASLAKSKLEELCQLHQPHLKERLHWDILDGKVADVMAETAHREETPIIVIGTNGASGFEKYWMGSTAVRIVQQAPCPTLTIREGYNFHKAMEHIVCPIRITADSRQKVPTTAAMAQIFGSTVDILGLIETAQDAFTLRTYLKQVENYFASLGIPYTSVGRRYENYSETVLNYAEEVHADLLVITSEQHKPLARLFLGTNAQQIVHNSQIPVLCVHPADIGSIAR